MFTSIYPGARTSPLTILCVGDSTVSGNTQPQYAWPLQLQNLPGFANVNVVNIGVNGSVTNDIKDSYNLIYRPYSPAFTGRAAILLWMSGANDFSTNGTAANALTNVQTLGAAALADRFLVGTGIQWDPVEGALTAPQVAQWNLFQGYQAALSGSYVTSGLILDTRPYFPDDTGQSPYALTVGDYHRDQAGQALIAGGIAAMIQTTNFLSL